MRTEVTNHITKKHSVLRYYAGPNYACWVYPFGPAVIMPDGGQVFHGYLDHLDQPDPRIEAEARGLGYLRGNVDLLDRPGDGYHFVVERSLLHAWLANRLHGRPSLWLWTQTRYVSDVQMREISSALAEEMRLVRLFMRTLNQMQAGATFDKLRDFAKDEKGINYAWLADAKTRFRTPPMTMEWRDHAVKDEMLQAPNRLPLGWVEAKGPYYGDNATEKPPQPGRHEGAGGGIRGSAGGN
jgi:hypothetical protein